MSNNPMGSGTGGVDQYGDNSMNRQTGTGRTGGVDQFDDSSMNRQGLGNQGLGNEYGTQRSSDMRDDFGDTGMSGGNTGMASGQGGYTGTGRRNDPFDSTNTQSGQDMGDMRAGGGVGDSGMRSGLGDSTDTQRMGGTGAGMGSGMGSGMGGQHHGQHHGSGVGTGAGSGMTGSTGHTGNTGKPGVGDKMMGGAQEMMGKMTKDPGLVEKGREKKTGMSGNAPGESGFGGSGTGSGY